MPSISHQNRRPLVSLPTLWRTSTHPQGSSVVRLSETSMSRPAATRTGKYAPPRWPCQPGNTACVCTARTHSCHHHGPAAIWPIVLIACHLHLAEIDSPFLVPKPAKLVVAVGDHLPGQGGLPPARVTTTTTTPPTAALPSRCNAPEIVTPHHR